MKRRSIIFAAFLFMAVLSVLPQGLIPSGPGWAVMETALGDVSIPTLGWELKRPWIVSGVERFVVFVSFLLLAVVFFTASMRSDPPPMSTRYGAGARRVNDSGMRPIMLGVTVCGIFFGALIMWSALAPVDSAAVAQAQVRVESNRLTLDHPEGGTIAELSVKEGDLVKAGELLMRLDTTDQASRLEVLRRRSDALLTLRARLHAERTNSDRILYPEELTRRSLTDQELAGMIDTQDTLFDASQQAFNGEIEIRRQRIDQLKERITGLEAQMASVRKQLTIVAEERTDLEALLKKGLTPQGPVLALRREEARLEGATGEMTASIAQTKAQIGETELAILQLTRNRLAESSETLRTSLTELLELRPQISALEKTLARSELRAPAEGEVFGLTKFTEGGVIRAGEPILYIVPDNTELIVEARISTIDRDVVQAGMPARVRFTAFSVRDVEPIEGVVRRVSADALTDETTRESFYASVVEISEDKLAEHDLVLQPGMPAEVIIPLTTRTPLQYLIEPLIRSWETAMREE